MLQARAHLRTSATRALVRPAAARQLHNASSSSSSSHLPPFADRSSSLPAAELGFVQRRWQEPQVALLQWSIVHHPRAANRVAGRPLGTGRRQYSSAEGAPPPEAAPALAQRPPPLPSSKPSSAPPPLEPPRPAPTPPSAPVSPDAQDMARRIARETPPHLAAQRQHSSPLVKPSGHATAPPPPPTGIRPPAPTTDATSQSAPVVAPPPSPRQIVPAEASDATSLELGYPARRPVALPRWMTGGSRGTEVATSAVHPASFFGPQSQRLPVKVAVPRVLSPIVSLNSLLSPTSSARPRPPARQTDLPLPTDRITYSHKPRGRWVSRDVANGRGPKPSTIDGKPFRRSESGVGPSDGAYALTASSVASDLVGESMEVMSYAALASPFLRPDATPAPPALDERQAQLVATLSCRLVDRAIREHARSLRVEEALELFAHTYPGWLPWGSRSDKRPRTPVADIDETVVFDLVERLIYVNNTGRARAILEHVASFADYVPTPAYYSTWIELYIGTKDYQAAQEQYALLADMPSAPLDDPVVGPRILRQLMRIGRNTASPKVTMYWFKKAKSVHGHRPAAQDLKLLIEAFAAARDVASVASVWRKVQELPLESEHDRRRYAKMFATCLELYAEAGVSLQHVSFFVSQAMQAGDLDPTPAIYNTVMRVAAQEENFDAAREIMRSMEEVGVRGRTFPAERSHYESLLLALDRQYPHKRKTALQLFGKGGAESRTGLEGQSHRARVDALADAVLDRVLEVVHEMKERNIELSGRSLVRVTRLLSFRERTRPESIKLAMALLSTLPTHDEGWSARNKWALSSPLGDGHARTTPALLLFSSLLKSLWICNDPQKDKLALQAFDHFQQLQSTASLSVVHIALLLSFAGRADEAKYIERLWEMALLKATTTSIPVALPSSEEEQLRLLTQPSLLDELQIKIPEPKSHQPHQELIGPAMASMFRVVNQHITPASLLYLEKEWLRVYQLNFGFDAASWSELARAYLGAGRFERGFQIVNDVILFRHHQLLREFELAHNGKTVPGAPSFAADPAAGEGLLSDEIQRAPAHYQDMVTKSYQLPFTEASRVHPLHNDKLLDALYTCAKLYGPSTGGDGARPDASIAVADIAADGRLLTKIGNAVSWAPTLELAAALERAQESLRAEARRQWHDDVPADGVPDGENPLQRAERFFDNYPRVQHLLDLRHERSWAGESQSEEEERLDDDGR